MKSVVCVLLFAAVVCGTSTTSWQPRQKLDISSTSRSIQQTAHAAVVDTRTPLHSALYLLESHVNHLVEVARQKLVELPEISISKVDMSDIFSCQSKLKTKTAILKSIVAKRWNIQEKIDSAKNLAHGLEFIIPMVASKQIDRDTQSKVISKINQFLEDYTQLLKQLKSDVCKRDVTSKIAHENYMDTPLAIFYEEREPRLDCNKDSGNPVCVKGR